jgi:hypothetical protein
MNQTPIKTTSWKLFVRAEWDRILAYLLIAAGAVLVLVAWIGVSGTAFVANQLAYIASGGIGGLYLLALGLALLMSADHHDEWRTLDAIEGALRDPGPLRLEEAPPGAPVVDVAPAAPAHRGRRSRVPVGSSAAEGRGRGLSVLSIGVVVSAVIVIVGWAHSSGTGRQGTAAEGLTLSLTGLLLGLAAVAAFLLPSRSRLTVRRAHLLRRFVLADALAGSVPAQPATTAGPADGIVLVAAGLSRYHRPGCPAVNGLAATRTALGAVDPTLSPCDLCHRGEQR